MKNKLTKAFLIGIALDTFLLVITFMGGFVVIVAPVVIGHLICSVGLMLYRRGDLTESDFGFIRFGLFYALWKFIYNFC